MDVLAALQDALIVVAHLVLLHAIVLAQGNYLERLRHK